MHRFARWVLLPAVLLLARGIGSASAAQLYIGATTVDITPDRPVALSGQMHTRISERVDSPLVAAIVALESREGEKSLDQAVMVACDLVGIPDELIEQVRGKLNGRAPELDPNKVFLSGTHTHTAPQMVEGVYNLPAAGIMRPAEYTEWLAERIAEAIGRAWQQRQPGKAGWGLGHAVVAQNRLAVARDGKATMYGPTNLSSFERFEGYEDHGVEVLCFWDAADKLIATAANVACPAQEVEGKTTVDADIWHPIREKLRRAHGDGLDRRGGRSVAAFDAAQRGRRTDADAARREPAGRTRRPRRGGLGRGVRRRGSGKARRRAAGPSGRELGIAGPPGDAG
jgi:hypothetical protein